MHAGGWEQLQSDRPTRQTSVLPRFDGYKAKTVLTALNPSMIFAPLRQIMWQTILAIRMLGAKLMVRRRQTFLQSAGRSEYFW